MLAHEIRQKYLDFFGARGHIKEQSASLVPTNILGVLDEATLFTGSGMEQFKPYFARTAVPPHTRIMTVQKCVRTNDIDSVGDYSHCTFFEMLGNFSFGDYFKAEVIPWTWEFLTQVVGLDPDRFCVTIYSDDDEAFDIWHNTIGLPADRSHRQGEDKNFWPASVLSNGPNGPCGPNSEVFYRVAPLEEMTTDPALSPAERFAVDDNAGRWLEVWNNVFTQFDRQEDADGKAILTPLPSKNNDTGAGLDRIAYVAQGKTSVFETDLFSSTLEEIARLSGRTYGGTMSAEDFAFRVVAEHTRSMVFCIADGITPLNEGRGYVLRYIIRRAIRFGKTALGFDAPFLYRLAPKVIEQMGGYYTELVERQELILSTIRTEEEQFHRTLDNGMRILDEMLDSGTVQQTRILSGTDAFKLYDTYGFPISLTKDLAAEHNIEVDLDGFERSMEEQREKSRKGSNIVKGVFVKSPDNPAAFRPAKFTFIQPPPRRASGGTAEVEQSTPETESVVPKFVGYENTDAASTVLAIYKDSREVEKVEAGEEILIVLDATPFYAESGGQVGDTGLLTAPAANETSALKVRILDTKKSEGIFLHRAEILEGELRVGQKVIAQIDVDRRNEIRRNHTATHLLQAALRQVLGGHVHQKGSEVAPGGLRFDFTHTQPVSPAELREIERIVNEQVLADSNVTVHVDVPIAEAKARGAMALFGEKYGDSVRMVEIPDFSLELCGGTHLTHTAQVGLFKIVRETGVASSVRRIEAVTGNGALDYVNKREEMLLQASALLKANPAEIVPAVERLIAQRKELEKQNRLLKTGGGAAQAAELTAQSVDGISVVAHRLENADAETVASLAASAATQFGSAIIVLGTVNDGKVTFAAKVTDDLVARGFHAGNLVREVAKVAGGNGGGRPDFAQAGGRDPDKLQAALDAVPALVAAQHTK